MATTSPNEYASAQFNMSLAIGVATVFALLFQIGHFAEHAFQFIVWMLGDLSSICGRDTPWMSTWATALVEQIGARLFPGADDGRRMMMGMEILHLFGNSIFLCGLAGLYHFVRSKWVRWSIYIETFHLYEHIMLATSAYFIGKPIGMSTLFGGSSSVFDRELAVGFRVTWHFAMNFLPMPFAMMGLMEAWRQMKSAASAEA